ncbi:MFS transporter [Cumulibacter manganitolerans]|uniref:MFS transporter n=1 Tax=Cumulibacter manganitolerans TaxID=1884992 RepID=UPI001885F8F4|nr:MFS transporter [Cumulibacter manganitolerans]
MTRTRDTGLSAELNRAVVVLCITELVAWGVLFYAMPVAADPMSADTGWSRSSIYGAFSFGLVTSAFIGIPLGWVLERHGPRYVMVGGALGTIPGILLVATAHSYLQLVAGWLVLGLAMPTLFYQAAFTACSGWLGERRVRGLTAVTLAGGVASTVFAPLTSALLGVFHWRTTWLILGAILVVVLVPLQWFFLTPSWTPVVKSGGTVSVSSIVRSARFIGLSASITTFTLCGFAVGLTIVSLMVERGFSHSFGATVLGVIGIGQLLGRLGFGRFGSPSRRMLRNLTIVAALVLSTLLFVVVPGPVWLMIPLAILLGASRGAGTLMHATMVVDTWGPERYGALVGVFTMPITISQAIAPWLGAAGASVLGSFSAMNAVAAALAACAGVGIYLSTRQRSSSTAQVLDPARS